MGYQAGQSNTTGTGNAAFGVYTLKSNTTGSSNTAIGNQALNSNTTANFNTAVGYQAMYQYNRTTDTDGYNTAIGYFAIQTMTSGQRNTALGTYCGYGLTTGSNNIYVGYNSQSSSGSVTNEINIGTVNGVAGKGASTGYINAGNGGVYQGNNGATWSVTSDQRLKKNIVDNNTGLDLINQIQVRNFEYRLPEEVDSELKPTDAIKKTGVQLGVIAQEIAQVSKEFVKTESTGVMSVNSDNLTWYLINAVKELNAEVQSLKQQLAGK